ALFVAVRAIYRSTPQGTIKALFSALRNKDEKGLERLSTPKGLKALRDLQAHQDKPWLDAWQEWAKQPEIRLHQGIHRYTQSGVDIFTVMTTNGYHFAFIKTPEGWKLNSCGSGGNE
ncbi:MAG TPA: hypothetical protein VNA16_09840, partial [Abditibacteriaceae bacterium]|nr:hypothetical protein [Abditibacteriaceae bacterium]